jgi:uncharacterized protein (TIGR00369 family)
MSDHHQDAFSPRNPNYQDEVQRLFAGAPFIRDLGLKLESAGPGRCRSRLRIAEKHQQQDGFVHAGVITTVADHTAGTAAATLIEEGQIVLSVEFKINMLRPAKGEYLIGQANVIKPGRTLSIVEAAVYCIRAGNRRWCQSPCSPWRWSHPPPPAGDGKSATGKKPLNTSASPIDEMATASDQWAAGTHRELRGKSVHSQSGGEDAPPGQEGASQEV